MSDGAAYSLKGKRVWVAGHRGMVGSALLRRLVREDCEILTVPRSDVDLRRQADVERWMADHRPEAIFLAASRVGGILANDSFPADFIYDNLLIEANIVHGAHLTGAQKLLFLGSSCVYPKFAPQPILEDSLLSGPLEPTNEWYAVAKIAGIKLTQAYRRQYDCDFISAMPTNLYGHGDNFDLQASHVLPALMRKAHDAKTAGAAQMTVWGSGAPRREFLNVDDCADALVFLMKSYSDPMPINVGSGEDSSIAEVARLVAEVVGFEGELVFDRSKPDGTPRKLMDGSRLRALGWRPSVDFRLGLEQTYAWFLENQDKARGLGH